MTPLVGTKNPSALVGDKSGGDGRAARALLCCSSWRGMGRLWRGMGGMGRAEPLAEHHPHQQQDHSGFHGSRETSQETRNEAFDSRSGRHGSARGASRKTAARSLLLCALWRGMGRLWRGMGGMGRPKQLSAQHPRQQQGHSSFHETRDPRPETRLLPGARQVPAGIPRFSRNTRHETRITAFSNHGFDGRSGRRGCARDAQPETPARTAVPPPGRCFSARCGAAWGGMGGMGGMVPPQATVRATSAPATGPFGFSRNPRPETRLLPGARQVPARIPRFFTKHETRNTNHGFFSKHGFFSIHGFFLACFGGRVVRNAG